MLRKKRWRVGDSAGCKPISLREIAVLIVYCGFGYAINRQQHRPQDKRQHTKNGYRQAFAFGNPGQHLLGSRKEPLSKSRPYKSNGEAKQRQANT